MPFYNMLLEDALKDCIEKKFDEKKLKSNLKAYQPNVWNIGLVEAEFHLCVKIFLEYDELEDDVRIQLLNCLIPREKITEETCNALLAWFFSNKDKNVSGSKAFLSWLSVMLSTNFIDSKPVKKVFNQLLMCFNEEHLISPICNVLKNVVTAETVSSRAVLIASSFYYLPSNYPEKKSIACLLRLFHACSPLHVPNPPSGKGDLHNTNHDFNKAVSILAFELGYLDVLPDFLLSQSIPSDLQPPNNKTALKSSGGFSENISDLPCTERMKYLALKIKNDEVPQIQSVSSVIGTREGQIYICWQQIMGNKLPSEDKFTFLPILRKILETCRRTRNGLPALSPILSRYLVGWDGEEYEEIIYSILSFIHFDSFKELYSNILCHFLNKFVTGILKDRINIIDCLTDLIENKITEVPPEATIELIRFVCRLIKIALASNGLQSSSLLITSLKFYKRVSYLEQSYMLGTWTIPPPFLVFGAFFSRNHVLISEVSELVVRHNVVMYPFYISAGIIHNFGDEEEVIKTYLRDLYFFLWKGQASGTELFADEEDRIPALPSKEIDAIFTARSHFAVNALVTFITRHKERSSSKQLNARSLLKVLDKYAPGISAVKSAYEGSLED